MARTTKQLSGSAKDKMLRGLVAQAGGLTNDDAARVCQTLAGAITDVRVRRDAWDVLRQGKAALVAALDGIGRLDDLRALALAQHLAIDPASTDVSAVRLAIIAATERRIAERKAAAS